VPPKLPLRRPRSSRSLDGQPAISWISPWVLPPLMYLAAVSI
jgi:hypothetical protein